MNGIIIAACLIGVIPRDYVLSDRVDALEVNNYYNVEVGFDTLNQPHYVSKLVFAQVLGRVQIGERDAIQWWVIRGKAMDRVSGPFRDHARRGWYVIITTTKGPMRIVRSTAFVESWTSIDLEIQQREHFARQRRRGLPRYRQPAANAFVDN